MVDFSSESNVPTQIAQAEIETNPQFHNKVLSDAFYTVNEFGNKKYYAARGWESSAEGTTVDLESMIRNKQNMPKFEVYIQEKSYGENTGRIYHFKYSSLQGAWMIEDFDHPGEFTRRLTNLQPLTIEQIPNLQYTYGEDGLEWGLMFSRIGKIAVLDPSKILDQPEQETDGTSMIIREFHKQQEAGGSSQLITSEEEERLNQIRDIGEFADEKPRWERLPKEVSIGQQLVKGAEYLWKHSMHDRDYLLKQGKSHWAVKRLLKRCNLKETGHALIKNDSTGESVLPQADFVVGKEDELGASVDIDKAVQKAYKRGEKVSGTIHTHPVFSQEYVQQVREKFKDQLPEDFELPPILADRQNEVSDRVYNVESKIAPPSVPDVAIAAMENGAHIVVSQNKIYCLVPTLFSRTIPDFETLYSLKHKKSENMLLKGIKALSERDDSQITEAEIEKLSLFPIQ